MQKIGMEDLALFLPTGTIRGVHGKKKVLLKGLTFVSPYVKIAPWTVKGGKHVTTDRKTNDRPERPVCEDSAFAIRPAEASVLSGTNRQNKS